LVAGWKSGDEEAKRQLFELVYDELRRLASWHLQSERKAFTLQPTALVNEAFLRLAAGAAPDWEGRVHLMAAFARTIRQVLVDHSRRRDAGKRGGGVKPDPLTASVEIGGGGAVEMLELDLVLSKLEELDARKCRIIELRFFAGMELEETAAAMGVSVSTVRREQAAAQAWLYKEMKTARQ
jgi:RNA polymerase sigma factor (TIGR02999 family)